MLMFNYKKELHPSKCVQGKKNVLTERHTHKCKSWCIRNTHTYYQCPTRAERQEWQNREECSRTICKCSSKGEAQALINYNCSTLKFFYSCPILPSKYESHSILVVIIWPCNTFQCNHQMNSLSKFIASWIDWPKELLESVKRQWFVALSKCLSGRVAVAVVQLAMHKSASGRLNVLLGIRRTWLWAPFVERKASDF